MNLKDYLKDHSISILIYLIFNLMIIFFLIVLKINTAFLMMIIFFIITMGILLLLYGYQRKKMFYQIYLQRLSDLDQKYLITELLPTANFLEGKILTESLYEIDKSMMERIRLFESQLNDFKDYIELWIHEVKLPISSLRLMLHNYPTNENSKLLEQIRRMEMDVEQVLYYVRSENAQQDYFMKEVSLKKIVSSVVKKNKEDFIAHHVKVELEDLDVPVMTDAKWLEFMINQIISNSLKYRRDPAVIQIIGVQKANTVSLVIKDNGIGIPPQDIDRVFEKSFTGQNGREKSTSTGMGLYIVKNMCHSLGHQIQIESEYGNSTTVTITFGKHSFYDEVISS